MEELLVLNKGNKMNPFSGIVNTRFKKIYKDAIDSLLEENALSVSCKFEFLNSNNPIYCSNCIFDVIVKRSSNQYNGTGIAPFPEDSICPVCLGKGVENLNTTESSRLLVIFDSKYWLNWNSKTMNIENVAAQTICGIELLNKIKNTSYIYFNEDTINKYTLAAEPQLAGLGDLNYLITLWTRQA
jgi:hypothetical protein